MRSYLQFQKRHAQTLARKRTEHLADISQDGSGKWDYRGEWMTCTLPAAGWRKVTAGLWCLLAGAAAACLICGCVPGTGMEGCFYVLLPYVSGLFAVCFCILHLAAVTAGGGRLRRYRYARHMESLAPCLTWGFLSCLLAAGGRIAEAFLSGGRGGAGTAGLPGAAAAFLALQAAEAALIFAALMLQKRMAWEADPAEKPQ